MQDSPLKDIIHNCEASESLVNSKVGKRLIVIFDEMIQKEVELNKFFKYIYSLDNNR